MLNITNFKFKRKNGIHLIILQNLYFIRLPYFADVNLFLKANEKGKGKKNLNYETVSRKYLSTAENFETILL